MSNILEIRDLQVHYGGIEAVKGISLDVPQGQIVTLIGANGAGKSSTLRAIAGLVKPSAGTITFQGEDITGKDSNLIVSRGITLVPEGRRIFPDMTVLLIEHHMDLVMKISDYIFVIDFGSEIARGVPKDVQHNKRVIEAYLGVSEDE